MFGTPLMSSAGGGKGRAACSNDSVEALLWEGGREILGDLPDNLICNELDAL